jgi:hypothetical protein
MDRRSAAVARPSRDAPQGEVREAAERRPGVEESAAIRCVVCSRRVVSRRGHQQHDLDAASEGGVELGDDLGNLDVLVLDVDCPSPGAQRSDVLREDRPFAGGDVERRRRRSGCAVAVAARVHRALDLDQRRTRIPRDPHRERQLVGALRPAHAVRCEALAAFVPALNEVVVQVGDRGPGDFQVDVVVLAFTGMSRRHQRIRIEIDAADERRLRILAGVDQPALLMLAVAWMPAVPPDIEVAMAPSQQLEVLRRAPERVPPQGRSLLVRPPENQANVEATLRRPLEHVQCRSPAVGHLERRPHEGDRRPDAASCRIDRLADAPECVQAVDQGTQAIAAARRVGACRHDGHDQIFDARQAVRLLDLVVARSAGAPAENGSGGPSVQADR